ncbi:MAG: TetR/AcrR family transcriptional regulator [Lachnospiraceae bacterium]|nr:TetR/AcrR family transcriptional regulator [Lachnospiraceae bacterium]
MRKKTITEEAILEASISLAAQNGLEHFTTKKAAALLNISEGTIFNNYPNKTALLVACLYHIDRQIDVVLKSVPLHLRTVPSYVHDMWYAYFEFLAVHGDYAKFYIQFRTSSYYTSEVIAGQNQSLSFFSKFLKSHMELFHVDANIFWTYIIETTMNFAVHVASGQIPCTQKEIDAMYRLISNGIKGVYFDKKVLK